VRVLGGSREAGEEAARGPLWFPLIFLAATAAFAEYPRLVRLGAAEFAQARLDATPDGMYASAVFFYLAFTWMAPLLAPAAAVVTGIILAAYCRYALDIQVERLHVISTMAYGFLPLGFERLLTGALRIFCPASCNPLNPLASNTAFFLPAKSTAVFWYEAARGLDIFSLWALVLAARTLSSALEEPFGRLFPPLAVLGAAALLLRAWLLG